MLPSITIDKLIRILRTKLMTFIDSVCVYQTIVVVRGYPTWFIVHILLFSQVWLTFFSSLYSSVAWTTNNLYCITTDSMQSSRCNEQYCAIECDYSSKRARKKCISSFFAHPNDFHVKSKRASFEQFHCFKTENNEIEEFIFWLIL